LWNSNKPTIQRTVVPLAKHIWRRRLHEVLMKTELCHLLGIEHPIIAAPMGPDLTGPEFVAAVSSMQSVSPAISRSSATRSRTRASNRPRLTRPTLNPNALS
jgi:hypothetical protein